jgi:hypothetical protein
MTCPCGRCNNDNKHWTDTQATPPEFGYIVPKRCPDCLALLFSGGCFPFPSEFVASVREAWIVGGMDGGETSGGSFTDTAVFPADATLRDVYRWWQDRRSNLGDSDRGDLTITEAQKPEVPA